ncbi:MAG: HD-GYP domain-containing protein [Chloroflexi bacterium]|nr:MAG: HD-GYP domain-containing protein [Chloroflexota bacterium]MBL1196510.1 HD-GYP domain-containing protein [Chloroflexota bacterium]NOH13806.1 HD-GYP domain-containing protein [Chloroflexota bacterium]
MSCDILGPMASGQRPITGVNRTGRSKEPDLEGENPDMHNETVVELQKHLADAHAQLDQAYDATLNGWLKILDLRDNETEGHTQRVAAMTVRLGQYLGIDPQQLVYMSRGALLHDIGKMAISDTIMQKPGPLDEEEWAIVRRHPTFAQEILSSIPYLKPSLDIPYCHHEKWDGTGYPQGLKGEEIPIAARVFAIVDVWDALRSDRPYRNAWPENEVMAYLQEQSGKHFQPEIVKAFEMMLAADETPKITVNNHSVSGTAGLSPL